LNDVVAGMEGLLHSVLGEDIDLRSEPAAELGTVEVDPHQFEQVVLNLAVNARDAMPQGGRLTIETASVMLDQSYAEAHPSVVPGPHVMLAVTDTGTGMEAATLARVFEPFFTTKELGQGTGLGLAMVYGIVKQAGGSIWAYSELGCGTSFKIYLPCAGTLPTWPPAARPSPVDATNHVGETILFVEDDPAIRRVVLRVLGDRGYSVLEAESGERALELVQAHSGPIDLLLTDVMLPGMDGLELAGSLRALRPQCRVLCVSGYPERAILTGGRLAPGLAFLEKPFAPETLCREVRAVMDGPAMKGSPVAASARSA
jgi:two-component system cell cycle sensor histidine kinase/response regulator CckA